MFNGNITFFGKKISYKGTKEQRSKVVVYLVKENAKIKAKSVQKGDISNIEEYS